MEVKEIHMNPPGIWSKCRLCHILLNRKDLISLHYIETHIYPQTVKAGIPWDSWDEIKLENVLRVPLMDCTSKDFEPPSDTEDDSSFVEEENTEIVSKSKRPGRKRKGSSSSPSKSPRKGSKKPKNNKDLQKYGRQKSVPYVQYQFNCYTCFATFFDRKDYQNHKKTHAAEVFKCPECPSTFKNHTYFELHKLKHSDRWEELSKDKFALDLERKKIVLERRRWRMEYYSPMTSVQCPHCPRTFPFESGLRRHIRFHTQEKPYTCRTCGTSFKMPYSLKEHVTGGKCEKVFEERRIRVFECDICGSHVKTDKTLRDHKLKQHGIHIPREVKDYHCEVCGYDAKGITNLVRHRRVHTGEKPFQCTACEKHFNSSHNMYAHMRNNCSKAKELGVQPAIKPGYGGVLKLTKENYTGEPSPTEFKCSKCIQTFSTKFRLNDHFKTHGDQFPCEYCDASFARKTGKYYHCLKAHPEQAPAANAIFKCHHCSKKLTSKIGLTMHIKRIHYADQPVKLEDDVVQRILSGNVELERQRKNSTDLKMKQQVVEKVEVVIHPETILGEPEGEDGIKCSSSAVTGVTDPKDKYDPRKMFEKGLLEMSDDEFDVEMDQHFDNVFEEDNEDPLMEHLENIKMLNPNCDFNSISKSISALKSNGIEVECVEEEVEDEDDEFKSFPCIVNVKSEAGVI